MTDDEWTTGWTRRRFIAAGSVAGVLGVAGCTSDGTTTTPEDTPAGETTTATEATDATETTDDDTETTTSSDPTTTAGDGFPRMTTEVDGDRRTPVIGNPDADVTVMAFENYLCGHCGRYSLRHYPELRSEYIDTGEIRYEFHDLPFYAQGWEESTRAPHAARAVWEDAGHEAFWEYSHALFANQSSLGPETYASLAEEVGADPQSAREAAVNNRYEAAVQADVSLAGELGVEATPTIIVNGEQTDGYGYNTIADAIDAEKGGTTA